MSTLAEQRKAIGQANIQRRGTGSQAESARRQMGKDMVERRTGAKTVEAINSVVRQPRQARSLPAVEPRGASPGAVGVGSYPENQRQTGGVASPLTEVTTGGSGGPVADREYYAAGLVSSDGLLVLPAIKKQTFLDAAGAEVIFHFAQPGMLP
jgi:hypothetical protein